MEKYLKERFQKIFKYEEDLIYFSPGRVNLIGEHIDYNGGHVFPAAISIGTYGIVKRRKDFLVKIYSEGYSKNIISFNINNFVKSKKNKWLNYVKGVFYVLKEKNIKIPYGFDLFIKSTLPSGSGLSSSASLESLIITILDDMFDLKLSLEEKATIGMEVENKYLGVNSGIMDQFACLSGKKDHAILLNTHNLKYEYIPFNLNDYELIIVNTNKKRGLTDSKYNERFNETRKSLKILQNYYEINNLCELPSQELENIKKYLNNDILYRRTKHAILEEQRTMLSKKSLENNDILSFGRLLNESHESLKNDYNVTGKELDTLQNLLIKNNAVGARMTGAGFGGCVIAVILKDKLEDAITNVENEYYEIIGYKPSFYNITLSDGTKII